MAFETIADSHSIIEGRRLPPHNSVLHTGMYGGFIAIFIFLMLVRQVFRDFMRYRKHMSGSTIPIQLQGTFIAWCMILLNSMFGGLCSSDYNFAIITSILLFQVSAAVKAHPEQVLLSNLDTPTSPSIRKLTSYL